MVERSRKRSDEVEKDRSRTGVSVSAAFGEESGGDEDGIELRTSDCWRSGWRTPVANPCDFVGELARVLSDQIAQLRQCLHN